MIFALVIWNFIQITENLSISTSNHIVWFEKKIALFYVPAGFSTFKIEWDLCIMSSCLLSWLLFFNEFITTAYKWDYVTILTKLMYTLQNQSYIGKRTTTYVHWFFILMFPFFWLSYVVLLQAWWRNYLYDFFMCMSNRLKQIKTKTEGNCVYDIFKTYS